MTTPATLHAIAADVVGHYGHAAKNLVTAYRAASTRALAGRDGRYAKFVGENVARTAKGYDRAIELVSGQTLKGLETFARRTEWARKLFVVDAVRRMSMPAAKLSLGIATRIDDASSALSARAAGPAKRTVAKRAAKKPAARRVRRTS